jgi:serine protease inhibitor
MKLQLLGLALSLALATPSFASLERVSAANQNFADTLVQSVVKEEHAANPEKNVFLSPLSASLALSMLLNGAEGSTFAGIAQTLQAQGLSLREINEGNQALVKSLSQGSLAAAADRAVPFTLSIANSVWSDSESAFQYRADYVKNMKSVYNAEVKALAFKKGGAVAVNQWASDKTNGKIPSIIDQDTMDSLWFILMNATYFKANWQDPFYEYATKANVPFTLSSGATVPVSMMQQSEKQLYWETNDAQVVELPYEGGRVSMLVVLPKAGQTVDALLAKGVAGGALLEDFAAQASVHRVNLSLPKFGFEYSVKLNDVLKALGMTAAFDDGANFAAIGSPASKVGLVKQNTFVKVDEKGTEAAAVTLIGGMEATSMPAPVPFAEMKVDRPFFVTVIDRQHRLPIFSGVVMNPEAK